MDWDIRVELAVYLRLSRFFEALKSWELSRNGAVQPQMKTDERRFKLINTKVSRDVDASPSGEKMV